VLDNFAYGDTPSLTSLQQFVETIAGQPQEFYISYYALAFDTDIRESVIRTLMTNLELRGLLESTTPRYEVYKFKPKVGSAHILNQFEGERRQFAGSVLAMAVKKKVWCEVNATHAATRLKSDRMRVVRMLEYFHQQQWIELETSGVVHGYRRLQPIADVGKLTQELRQYVTQRETGEIARLDQMYALFGSNTCQSAMLSEHFGEKDQVACGHCSACHGKGLTGIPVPNFPQVGDSARTAVGRLQHLHPELLTDAHQQAKFLCGLSSPKFTRARLSRDSAFGCCSHIPFNQVLQLLQSR
jgi:ATP-dependent DNA helicase RecQ